MRRNFAAELGNELEKKGATVTGSTRNIARTTAEELSAASAPLVINSASKRFSGIYTLVHNAAVCWIVRFVMANFKRFLVGPGAENISGQTVDTNGGAYINLGICAKSASVPSSELTIWDKLRKKGWPIAL